MQTDWASENLQVIRTLMERSTVYRRALAPIMSALGVTGTIAAAAGFFINFTSARTLVLFWMGISIIAILEAFLLVRRQAINASEHYWTPPTRRVMQAVLPPLFAGFTAGLPFLFCGELRGYSISMLVPAWIIFYGCALHSAGFFMPRGIKLFGWGFTLSGCVLGGALAMAPELPPISFFNIVMGFWFGVAHIAYGIYLYFTERSRSAV